MILTTKTPHRARPTDPRAVLTPVRRRPVGLVVAASLATGLVTAAALAVVAFAGAEEPVITGSVLLAFALGWALLAVGSTLWTDQPQRWAAVPAGFMGIAGAGLLIFAPDADTLETLGWVWPPALLTLVVWMTISARRQLRSGTRRWLLYPVFSFLALASLGGVYETLGESLHREALPAGGRLVDVGGHRLYLHCSGSGSPVVVLTPGLGEGSSAWKTIEPTVARETRVCAYDPAGRGRSESAPRQETSVQTVNDLRTLLRRAREPGPYVFVGHSLGGATVLNFAQEFPDEVAGVTLVDSMTPYQFTKLPGYARFYDGLHRASGLLPSVARLGIGRIIGSEYGVHEARSFRDEIAGIPEALDHAQELESIGGKPLIVLTAGRGQEVGWAPAQADLTTLSTNSVQRVARRATHTSLLDDRADAAVSSRAIRDVVRSARAAGPLAKP